MRPSFASLTLPVALAVACMPMLLAAAPADKSVTTQTITVPPKIQSMPALPGRDLMAPPGATSAPTTPATPLAPLPEVHYGEDGLPPPVAKLRASLIAAARTGNLEALRPIFAAQPSPPMLSTSIDGDPIDVLRDESGDPNGREVLANLWSALDAGWVVVDKGTPNELYVWPYFARMPLDRLTPPQEVELYRLVTAGDVQAMQEENVYSFFRVEIAPDGTWRTFLSDL